MCRCESTCTWGIRGTTPNKRCKQHVRKSDCVPELPEVETVCRSLRLLVHGKTVRDVRVTLPRIVRTPRDPKEFAWRLRGVTIEGIARRGKYILFDMSPYSLVSHLRMEGRYGLYAESDALEAHTHVVFAFTDGTELRYRDVRQFGTMDLIAFQKFDLIEGLRTLGPEPLSAVFTVQAFREIVQKRSMKIKQALLDQTCVAGLGNIYVDETLFDAGIHPARPCNELTEGEIGRIHASIQKVLAEAVDAGGSSIKSYVNGHGEVGKFQLLLKAYGRTGQACLNCGSAIEKVKLSGRGTHYCPTCQQMG